MIPYQAKIKKLSGSSYKEIHSKSLIVFKKIKAKTKRRPYVRSAYFKKQKIFFDYFWQRLWQKSWKQRNKRLKYLSCAIELIHHSCQEPVSKPNPNKKKQRYFTDLPV